MRFPGARKPAAIALCLALVAVRDIESQLPARPGVANDSLKILNHARSLQSRFESSRRFQAPFSYESLDGPCDHIGRFCLHHTGVPLSEIPDEPRATRRARARLLASLDSAAAVIPGDDWITGQRIRYLTEARDDSGAARVARECAGSPWWCVALRGLAYHSAGETSRAEAAFDSALMLMRPARRCAWIDISQLLEPAERGRYRKLACTERESVNARIWLLSDPLYSVAGNDRRAEHFARQVWAELERQSANGFGMRWGTDMTEMTVRFGRSEKWTQDAPSSVASLASSSVRMIGHEREPNFHFLPVTDFDWPMAAVGDSSWRLSEEMPPEAYGPPYARSFVEIRPQIARFARGDSTLVVTGYDVSSDTAWHRPFRASVAVVPVDAYSPRLYSRDSASVSGAMIASFTDSLALVSVELLARDSSRAGRWRSAVHRLESGKPPRLSDLLLFDAHDSLSADFPEITRRALGTTVLARDRKTGVYWETYGIAGTDSAVAVSLELRPLEGGFMRKAIRALGFGQAPTPVNISWREVPGAGGIAARMLRLDLSRIPAGKYELRLEIGGAAGAIRSRFVEIR